MKKVSSEFVTHLLNTQPPKGGTTNFTRAGAPPTDLPSSLGARAGNKRPSRRRSTGARRRRRSADRSHSLRKAIWSAYVSPPRSEEHTSELQSLRHLVCRLLLE